MLMIELKLQEFQQESEHGLISRTFLNTLQI